MTKDEAARARQDDWDRLRGIAEETRLGVHSARFSAFLASMTQKGHWQGHPPHDDPDFVAQEDGALAADIERERGHDNPDFEADWQPTPERLARDLADSAI